MKFYLFIVNLMRLLHSYKCASSLQINIKTLVCQRFPVFIFWGLVNFYFLQIFSIVNISFLTVCP